MYTSSVIFFSFVELSLPVNNKIEDQKWVEVLLNIEKCEHAKEISELLKNMSNINNFKTPLKISQEKKNGYINKKWRKC